MPGKQVTEAPPAVEKLIRLVMEEYHGDLLGEKARVRAVMVEGARNKYGELTAPALTAFGVAAAAKIRVANPRERVLCECDVILQIDADGWSDLTEAQKRSLLDHELTHIQVKRDKNGLTKRRDDGSAVFESIPDDYCINGFFAVMQRHKSDSMEALGLRRLAERGGQLIFGFMETLLTAEVEQAAKGLLDDGRAKRPAGAKKRKAS